MYKTQNSKNIKATIPTNRINSKKRNIKANIYGTQIRYKTVKNIKAKIYTTNSAR